MMTMENVLEIGRDQNRQSQRQEGKRQVNWCHKVGEKESAGRERGKGRDRNRARVREGGDWLY